MTQANRPQFGQDGYHDLTTFQAFQIMQLQLALAQRDQDIQVLAQKLAEANQKIEDAELEELARAVKQEG